MKWWRQVAFGAALMVMLTVGVGAGPALAQEQPDEPGEGAFTFAVIGDIPYGDAQVARFPAVVDQINADPAVQLVDHLGDIKSGSSVCSDAYFAMVRTQFDRFVDPLVYTPGDNEWTDCHRPNNGGFSPLERLDAVRQVFFPSPGRTLGQHAVQVVTQAERGFVENVSYSRAGIGFAALHVVGSNNGLVPWTGNSAPTPEQQAEVAARTAATLALIDQTFAKAEKDKQRAVVLLTQADMFDVTVPDPQFADYSAFQPIVREIAAKAAAFGGPVYLFNGDSHVYNADAPLAPGSRWLSFYDVQTPAGNLDRITVDGSTEVDEYLRVTVHPQGPQVLNIVQVPFT
ncbi:MAG: metallophosphoesterase [Pseudonocardia sp.]